MIGGIFLEIPFGDVYHQSTVSRIHTNINRSFGFDDKYFTKVYWDKKVLSQIYKIAKTSIGKHRGDVRKDFNSRTGDLIRSTAMGVFYNGKWDGNLYRFTGGPDNEDVPSPNTRHPDKDTRARDFMSSYELAVQSRFSVVIAATMPYAVRLEKEVSSVVQGKDGRMYHGYDLAVLKYGINRIGNDIFKARPDSQIGKAQYGYIFETNGGREIVKPNVA
jgi:hypothetical protein